MGEAPKLIRTSPTALRPYVQVYKSVEWSCPLPGCGQGEGALTSVPEAICALREHLEESHGA